MIAERRYIKDALYLWAAAVVADNGREDPVIWDNGAGVRPKPPFISLRFLGGSRPGLPMYTGVTPDNEGGSRYIIQPSKKALTMYGFGEGAYDLLQTMYDAIHIEKYRAMLAEKGLVIPYAADVVETGALLDTAIEQQAYFDFHVTFERVIVERLGYIENITINPSGVPMEPI